MATETWTRVSVRRTHLELRAASDLRAAPAPRDAFELGKRQMSPAEYLALYALVGEPWLWRDRLAWTDAELAAYLTSPGVQIWTLRVGGETAGYFELKLHPDHSVELMYFGLVPAFIGRGLGGWLLTRAAQTAFSLGAKRLFLNTCTLDAPQALPNYLARGFTIVSEDQYLLDVPVRVQEQRLPSAARPAVARG